MNVKTAIPKKPSKSLKDIASNLSDPVQGRQVEQELQEAASEIRKIGDKFKGFMDSDLGVTIKQHGPSVKSSLTLSSYILTVYHVPSPSTPHSAVVDKKQAVAVAKLPL